MFYVGVVGASDCSPEVSRISREVGRLVAAAGCVLVCGGRGGVMEAASRGAREGGGLVMGILPGTRREEGNRYLTVSVVTGMGEARNAIITRSCDAIIAISGGFGTLSEIGLALKMGVPVIGLDTWQLARGGEFTRDIIPAQDPRDAVDKALTAIRSYPR